MLAISGNLWRHKPLHLSEDQRQLGSHINFGAKLPAKWQVTHDSIYPAIRQRYHCIHRTHTERSEVGDTTSKVINVLHIFRKVLWYGTGCWSFSYSQMKLLLTVFCFQLLQTLCSHSLSVSVHHQCPYQGKWHPKNSSKRVYQMTLLFDCWL